MKQLIAALFLSSVALAQSPVFFSAFSMNQGWGADTQIYAGQIVKINTNGRVTPVAAGDTIRAIGVAQENQMQPGGAVTVGVVGEVQVLVDNNCIIGQFVNYSATKTGWGTCSASAGNPTIGIATSPTTRNFAYVHISPTSTSSGGSGGGSSFYQTIQSAGTALTQRNTLNFLGTAGSCVDNAVQLRTDCTFNVPTVQNSGAALTQRPNINFTGSGVSCVDDSVNNRTICTITSGSGTANPASVHNVTAASTTTLTCTSATAGTLDMFLVTLGMNISTLSVTSCTPGQDVLIGWIQNSSGGWIVGGIPGTVKNLIQPTTTANVTTFQFFRFDGTNYNAFPASDSNGNGLFSNIISTSGAFQSLTVNGAPIVPAAGVKNYTASHTIGLPDIGGLIKMNCSAPCVLTLEASPGSQDWFAVQSIGSVLATIALGGNTYNSQSTPPPLTSYIITAFQWDPSNATWSGEPPPIAGPNVTITCVATGCTYSSSGGGSGGGQINYPVNSPARIEAIGMALTAAGPTLTNSTVQTSLLPKTFAGRNVIPAGSMIPDAPGPKSITVTGGGPISTNSSGNSLALSFIIGGGNLPALNVPTLAGVSSLQWSVSITLTVVNLTSVQYYACAQTYGSTNAALSNCISGTLNTLNFATDQSVDLQALWGSASASNSVTLNVLTLVPGSVI